MEQINNLLLHKLDFSFAPACINQEDLCSDEQFHLTKIVGDET